MGVASAIATSSECEETGVVTSFINILKNFLNLSFAWTDGRTDRHAEFNWSCYPNRFDIYSYTSISISFGCYKQQFHIVNKIIKLRGNMLRQYENEGDYHPYYVSIITRV